MSQVNLLPPEIRQRQKTKRLTGIVAVVGAIVVLLILALWFVENMNLTQAQEELAAQESTNAQLQTQVDSLQRFADIQGELQSKKTLEATVYKNEVAFSGVLVDISRIVPTESVLDSVTAQITASEEAAVDAAETGGNPEMVGSINFSGTLSEISTLTEWLARQGEVRGWTNPYTSTAQETTARSRVYTFASSVDLTQDALTERGKGLEVTP